MFSGFSHGNKSYIVQGRKNTTWTYTHINMLMLCVVFSQGHSIPTHDKAVPAQRGGGIGLAVIAREMSDYFVFILLKFRSENVICSHNISGLF